MLWPSREPYVLLQTKGYLVLRKPADFEVCGGNTARLVGHCRCLFEAVRSCLGRR